MKLSDALASGYLPQELPPCFSSADFATKMSSLTLPSAGKWRYPAKFSLTRAGGLRRSAEIPNPFSQYYLAQVCSTHWRQLQRLSAQSPISLSRPVRSTAGRSLAYKRPITDWSRELVARMPGGRVTVKTDIGQFYPSIYVGSQALRRMAQAGSMPLGRGLRARPDVTTTSRHDSP